MRLVPVGTQEKGRPVEASPLCLVHNRERLRLLDFFVLGVYDVASSCALRRPQAAMAGDARSGLLWPAALLWQHLFGELVPDPERF